MSLWTWAGIGVTVLAQAPPAYGQGGSTDSVRQVERRVELDARLDESSGLAFDAEGRLFTVNDGEAILYEVDTLTGGIRSERRLSDGAVVDWEALALHGDTLYVGDFGNNASGNRTDLRVLRYYLSSNPDGPPRADTIAFTYADQSDLSATPPNEADFDCEAFVVTADSIYLFTKEWVSLGTAVYALPNVPGRHVAQWRGRLDGVGLVTDAHFRPGDSLLVLSGYSPVLKPFVYVSAGAAEGDFFSGANLRVQVDLPLHQVEGIASSDGRRYFLSNERFERSIISVSQGLSVLSLGALVDGLSGDDASATGAVRLSPKQGLRVWPNPMGGRSWVRASGMAGGLRAYDGAGREVGAWTLDGGDTEIDCGAWPAGTYYLVAPGAGAAAVTKR